MEIYCYMFVIIVEKETQIFYNVLYMCLKRINFLFKTPASPFSPGFLIIRERTFYLEFVIMWEASETNQASSANEFSPINGWTIIFGLIRIFFSCGIRTGFLRKGGLRALGNIIAYLKLVQSKSREEPIPVFRNTLEIILKERNAYGRPIFQSFIMHPSPDSKDLDIRLYIV